MNSRRLPEGDAVAGARIVKWNVEPRPAPALSTSIVPPINSASSLLIARPRPVPPYLRVVLLSAWLNFWKRRLLPSADSPMPVSRIVKRSTSSASAFTVSTTSPRSVNLTALLNTLSNIWRSRVTSPTMAEGTSPSN